MGVSSMGVSLIDASLEMEFDGAPTVCIPPSRYYLDAGDRMHRLRYLGLRLADPDLAYPDLAYPDLGHGADDFWLAHSRLPQPLLVGACICAHHAGRRSAQRFAI